MPSLNVLLISDGRPGHYRLAEGIIAGLARLRPINVQRLEVRRWWGAPTRSLAWLINAGLPAAWVLKLGYGFDARDLPKVDVIVSAGGDTLAANVAAARLLGAPNIFYGSLRRYDGGDFALSLSSYERPGQVMALKPSAFDPDTLPPAPAFAGLIIGGDTPDIRYRWEDWQRLASYMRETHVRSGTQWVVSNSRRTPDQASHLVAELAAERGGPIQSFIDVRSAAAGSLVDLFAHCATILCTADSSSMLSESVWARRPVIAIRPAAFKLTDAEAGYRRYLEKNGWAAELAIAELAPERVAVILSEIEPLKENPLDQLAATLRRELPQLVAK
jgi:mitochondrial fission protein ELM1